MSRVPVYKISLFPEDLDPEKASFVCFPLFRALYHMIYYTYSTTILFPLTFSGLYIYFIEIQKI